MRLSLAIQCLNVWDFSPAEGEMQVLINGLLYPHVAKPRGYLIITKQLPDSFCLEIFSKKYLRFKTVVKELNEDKILLCELILRNAPINSTVINVQPPATIVLGYDYYRLAVYAQKGETSLTIQNPHSDNTIEGRRFLLHDTLSNAQQLLILGDATNLALTQYKIPPLLYSFLPESSILIPSFLIHAHPSPQGVAIPIKSPPHPSSIWRYKDGERIAIN